MFVKYDTKTMQVLGFLVKNEENCIEVDSAIENQLLSMQTKGSLFIKDIEKKEFEVKQIQLTDEPKNEMEILLKRLQIMQDALDYAILK